MSFIRKILAFFPFFILLAVPFFIKNLKSVQHLVSRAFYRPASLMVDAGQTASFYFPNWLSFAQGGEEPGKNMLAPAAQAVRTLNPRYIRLDHIFDDAYYGVVRRENGQLVFDFSRLDEAVNTITATGAVPFLVLSYMPSALADSLISLPDNWTEWESLVRATVQHYSGISAKNLNNVYYEVWNEPDLESFGGFRYFGEKNYLDLYYHSAVAIRTVNNCRHFKLGGPATTGLYQNWIKALVQFCEKNSLPLGFVSFHHYSFYPDRLLKEAEDLKSYLSGYPRFANTEIVVSEWGPDGAKNPLYNSQMAAAFTLATVSELKKELDMVMTFELKDGPQTNSWGLLGHESQGLWAKPRYQLFNWLAGLDKTLYSEGNGSYVKAVAGRKKQNTVLIAANYDLEGEHNESVPVEFNNLSLGKYRLSKQLLGQPVFYEDILLDRPTFQYQLYLQPNTVARLELQPLD